MRSCRKSNKLNGNGNGMGWDGGCMGRGGEWTCSGQRNAHPRWLSNALGDPDRNWQLLKKTRTISSGSAAPSWSALQVAIETSQNRDTGKRLLSPVSLLYISLSSADIFPSILSRFSRLQQVPDGQISECIYSKTYVYIDRQINKQTDMHVFLPTQFNRMKSWQKYYEPESVT